MCHNEPKLSLFSLSVWDMLRVSTFNMRDKSKHMQENYFIKCIQMKSDMLWHSFNVLMFFFCFFFMLEIMQPIRHIFCLESVYELQKNKNKKTWIFMMRIHGLRNWVDICIWKTNGIFSIKSSWWFISRQSFCLCNARSQSKWPE